MKEPGSQPLAKEAHEAFAAHFALNGNAAAAWVHATAGDPAHSDANGSKWKRISSIIDRVRWLRAEAERRLEKKVEKQQAPLLLSLMEKRQFLARVVRSKLAEEEDDSDLWQEIEITGDKVKRKLPGKLEAISLDTKLAGDAPPEEVNVTCRTAPEAAAVMAAMLGRGKA